MMQASIVVLTGTRWGSLARCLNALLSQTFAHDEYEIIVVSDEKTGIRQEMSPCDSDPRVRFLQQSNQSVAAAMNAGIRTACGEIVVFIQDDCICEPGVVSAHVDAHGCDENLVVLGPTLLHSECQRNAVNELIREHEQRDSIRFATEGPSSSDLILRANSSVRRSFLQKHLFDESNLGNFVIEQGFHLYRAGAQVRYAPTAVTYQFHNETPDALVSEARDLSAFEVSFARNHPEYRAMSSIAKWSRNSAKKRILRSLIARSAFSPEPILKLLFQVIQPLQRRAVFLRAARRLLKLRVDVTACRAAVSVAGSWTQLHALFLLRVPILLYHHVTADSDSSLTSISMTRSTFERQMKWLSTNGYQGIGISEFIAWRENNSHLPPKPVLITFDDAYDDTAQHAFPILQRLGFSAACMVVTQEIGNFNRWDSKLGWKRRQLMNREAALHWKQRGIEYGAHSCSHPDLRTLEDNDLQRELAASRQQLEHITSSRVRTFAYPYGYFDRRVKEEAARFFDFAFTTEPRPSNLATDPHLLGRMEPLPSDSYLDFVSRVRWGWTLKLRVRAIFADAIHRTKNALGIARAGHALDARPAP